jgi:CheY-like chemotaxis protein
MPARPSKPAIMAVDDDPQVLAAVARDLRRQYGERYRILRAPDGYQALAAVEELTLASEPLALIVADQRMPGLSGIDLLTRARELQPETRMVLLTAYADTDAAITAINEVRLDYYVLKPWDPPEERLYPALDEVLDEWEASFHPPFRGSSSWGIAGHRTHTGSVTSWPHVAQLVAPTSSTTPSRPPVARGRSCSVRRTKAAGSSWSSRTMGRACRPTSPIAPGCTRFRVELPIVHPRPPDSESPREEVEIAGD